MKTLRKRKGLIITLLVLVLLVLLRGPLFRLCCGYASTGTRAAYPVTSPLLEKEISARYSAAPPATVDALVDLAQDMTTNRLSFTSGSCSADPNRNIQKGKTHCVGYAAYFATVCRSLLQKKGWAQQYRVEALRGQLYVFGVNIHPYFSSPFFRDHDFCRVTEIKTGRQWNVDPSLNDYTGIARVRAKN